MGLEINRRRLEVLRWADEHDWIVDPFKGMDFHIEDFEKLQYCPCDKTHTRTTCPCPDSVEDVEKNGKCLCGLFWTKDEVVKRIRKWMRARREI